MIPAHIIQDILERAPIEDVIASFIPDLKKKGSSYTACCPFHTESTPSFHVAPVKGFYKCFGCGKGGNSVSFLMEHKHWSFPESIKWLADKYGILIVEEEQSPEQVAKLNQREELLKMYAWAADEYRKALAENLSVEDSKEINDRFTPDQIAYWGIGYAPAGWDFLTKHLKIKNYKEEFLENCGLIVISEKKGSHIYDKFRQRLMFPVMDHTGRTITFAGRDLSGPHADPKTAPAKWMNGPDTLLYKKEKVLFGLYQAVPHIRNRGYAIVVEGNGDVAHMHLDHVNQPNTVAAMGTALTRDQILLLKRHTDTVYLLFDGDKAGYTALLKNAMLCLKEQMHVYCAILPVNKDPEDFFIEGMHPKTDGRSSVHASLWMESEKKNFIIWRAQFFIDTLTDDPIIKRDAVTGIGDLLIDLADDLKTSYVKDIAKLSKKRISEQDINRYLTSTKKVDTAPEHKFPKEIDRDTAENHGFYSLNNSYKFKDGDDFKEKTNFIMKPIFHILNSTNPRRVYQFVNNRGFSATIDLDMTQLVSIQAFKKKVEGIGNLVFEGTDYHMTRLKKWLYENTLTCKEIENMGWQKEGFFAWANGITTLDGLFHPIDDFGRVSFKDKNYYLAAFSEIHIDDKEAYPAERRFRYREEGEISIEDWSDLFMKVYKANGRISFCYYLATLFRDHIMRVNKKFPLLNYFGPRGTGKNYLARSILYLFGDPQGMPNLHNLTKASFSDHVRTFSNAIAVFDEYKNHLDKDIFEMIKGLHEGEGRTRTNMETFKKETTEVNSAVIIMGQEKPTADPAMFQRVIFCQFHKDKYTEEEEKDYERLNKVEEKGISHITHKLLQHRSYFIKNIYEETKQIMADFRLHKEASKVATRNMQHYALMLASYKLISLRETLPVSVADMSKTIIQVMVEHYHQQQSSSELNEFWDLIESLFDEEKIIDGWHFRIRHTHAIDTNAGLVTLPDGQTKVLCIKFNVLSKLYTEHGRRMGLSVLPKSSLESYLKNSNAFLAHAKAVKFTLQDRDPGDGRYRTRSGTTSSMCFDYDLLKINLIREDEDRPALAPHNVVPLNSQLPEDAQMELNMRDIQRADF